MLGLEEEDLKVELRSKIGNENFKDKLELGTSEFISKLGFLCFFFAGFFSGGHLEVQTRQV